MRPKQARSLKTEQNLLDALERLLAKKHFEDLTVSELAGEAGVTTGAIYRRFANKEDVLRAAFHRFQERTQMVHDRTRPDGFTDRELLKNYLGHLMDFTYSNIHIMRAANSLNDVEAFDRMNRGRAYGAKWLSENLHSSTLTDQELVKRCKFVLRVATATFRDTFLAGRGAAVILDEERMETERQLERLCSNLADMAGSYLKFADEKSDPQG